MQIVIITNNDPITLEIDPRASLYDLIKTIHRQHSQYDIDTYSYGSFQLNTDHLAQPLTELLAGEGLKNITGHKDPDTPADHKNNLSKKALLAYEHTFIPVKQRLEATRLNNRYFLSPLRSKIYHQKLPSVLQETLPHVFPSALAPIIASFVGSSDCFMVIDMVAALGLKEFSVGNAYVSEVQAVTNQFHAYLALFFNKAFRLLVPHSDGHLGLFIDVSAFPKLRQPLRTDPTPNSYFTEFAEAKASLRPPFATTSFSSSGGSYRFQSYECIIHYQLDGQVTAIYAPHAPEPFSKFEELIYVNCWALAVNKNQLSMALDVLKASVTQFIVEKIVKKEGLKIAHPKKVSPISIKTRSSAYHLAKASFLSCQNPGFQKQWNESDTLEEIVADVHSPTGETRRTLSIMLGQSEQWLSEHGHQTLLCIMLRYAQLQCLAIQFETEHFTASDSPLESLKKALLEGIRRFKSELKSTDCEAFVQAEALERRLILEVDTHQVIISYFDSCQARSPGKISFHFFEKAGVEPGFQNLQQSIAHTIMQQENIGLPADILEMAKEQSNHPSLSASL